MEVNNEENIKAIFNKWGTYQSLQKDVAIVQYFMDRIDQRIRQKTIVEHFKSSMHPKTCREHLYKLVNKRVLHEDEDFKGTYVLPSRPIRGSDYSLVDDMNSLIQVIVGSDIYDMAISRLKNEYKSVITDLKKQLNEYREELRMYR